MLKTVSIDQLVPGHYVTRVIAQEGTLKVKSQGKVAKSQTIENLRKKGVKTLEIDISRSDLELPTDDDEQVSAEAEQPSSAAREASGAELQKANDLYTQAVSQQGAFLDQLQQGAVHDLSEVKQLSEQLIENLLDNPNALSCLTLIKDTDQYLMEHSLNCSILMAMFAEYLGYDSETVEALALGALLMDVGMASAPDDLRLQNVALSTNDWQVIKNHVDHGLEMLEQTEDLPSIAKTVVAQHHERIDGSGYPNALEGEDVSEFGRMAAIVDSYDAMLSNRAHRKGLAPAVALKRLSRAPGLDTELVQKFIARIGIHPVGSLVKLKSGKLGIVAKVNEKDMINPVVMTFYSITSAHYNDVKRVDLSKVEDEIDASVQPADFNINLPKFFREVFVHQV